MCEFNAFELKKMMVQDIASYVGDKIKEFEDLTGLAVSEIEIERVETTTVGELAQGERNYLIGHVEVTIK